MFWLLRGRHRFSSEAASGEFLKLRQRKLAEALNLELEWYRASGICALALGRAGLTEGSC